MALAAVSYAGIPASALPAVTGDSGRPGFRWKQDVCAHCWGVLEGGPEFTKPEHRQVGCPLHTGGLVWARGESAPKAGPSVWRAQGRDLDGSGRGQASSRKAPPPPSSG